MLKRATTFLCALLVLLLIWQTISNRQLEHQVFKLDGKLQTTEFTILSSQQQLNKQAALYLQAVGENKKLLAKIGKLTQVSQRQGKVTLNMQVRVTSDCKLQYSDQWQDITVSQNYLSYQWHFSVQDIELRTEQNKTVYTVYLLGNKGQVRTLDYNRQVYVAKPQGFLWLPTWQGGFSYYQGLEGSILVSPIKFVGNTDENNKRLEFLFPQASISSNLQNSFAIGLGAAWNLGRSFFQAENIWLNLRYLWGTGAVLGVSASL